MVTVLALMDFTVQWQRLMSLLAIMTQEQCPETECTGTVATVWMGRSQEVSLEGVMF